MLKRWAVCILLGPLFACGLAAPSRGELVEGGVGRAVFEVRSNGTDLVKLAVLFPASAEGTALGTLRPALVFIQGGFVASRRYEWQAEALARAGYVVVLPDNQLELAFFSIDSGEAARQLLVTPPTGSLLEGLVDPQRIAVGGHSLGSVVAMKLALQGGFAAVVLEAGFPDTADAPKLSAFSRPSLSLAGALDCSATLPAVRTGWEGLPAPTALAVLEGVTHYQFTDSDTEDRQRKCVPEADLADAHQRISSVVLAFLDAALGEGGVGEAGLRLVPGASVEVR